MKKKIIYVDFIEKRKITFFRFNLNKFKDFIFNRNKFLSKNEPKSDTKKFNSNNTFTKIY